jgi:hypothetical protein
MVGIGAVRVVVGIVRRLDADAARHPHDVLNADGLARVALRLPFRHRRRLVERIHAAVDERAGIVPVTLLPIDQLSSGVDLVMPSP